MPARKGAFSSLKSHQKKKFRTVMREFGQKKLRHGSTGKIVTDPKVAVAIAFAEARRV